MLCSGAWCQISAFWAMTSVTSLYLSAAGVAYATYQYVPCPSFHTCPPTHCPTHVTLCQVSLSRVSESVHNCIAIPTASQSGQGEIVHSLSCDLPAIYPSWSPHPASQSDQRRPFRENCAASQIGGRCRPVPSWPSMRGLCWPPHA
jgi:hypothetical protein